MRAGRTTKRQQHALEEYSKDYIIAYTPKIIPFNHLFVKAQKLVVEIGFGMGNSLLEMAQSNPSINYIGIEVHEPGVGNILAGIHEYQLDNLLIMKHDAVEIFQHCIQDHALEGVQIFFPDPWHKKRHHKRRLVNPEFTQVIAQKLTGNAFVHFATDWQEYANEVLELFENNFVLNNAYKHFAPRPQSRPLTKFEKRGQRLEHGVWDIIFTKSSE